MLIVIYNKSVYIYCLFWLFIFLIVLEVIEKTLSFHFAWYINPPILHIKKSGYVNPTYLLSLFTKLNQNAICNKM